MRKLALSFISIGAALALTTAATAGESNSLRSSGNHTAMPVQSYIPSALNNSLNTSYLLKRAIVNFKEGDISTASMLLHRTLRSDPYNPIAHYYMGLTKQKQGNMKRAVRHLTLANKVFANAPQSYAALGEVYAALGRVDDANRLIARLDSVKGASAADIQSAKTIIQAAIARS